MSESDARRAWREANKEKCREYTRQYRERNKESIAARRAELRRANIEESLAKEAASRAANPEAHRAKARRSYVKHRDENLERRRDARLLNLDARRERERIYAARARAKRPEAFNNWKASNPDKERARTAAWRAKNPGRISAWLKAHPEKVREYNLVYGHARRARIRGNSSNVKLLSLDIKRLGNVTSCYYCGDEFLTTLHMEHVIPIARGGRHALGNVVMACPCCNLSKGSRTVAEWRYRNGAKVWWMQ